MNRENTLPPPGELPDSFLTCAGEGRDEIRVQRSRFLGICRPVADRDAIEAELAAIRREFHDARHVCYAWRTGVGPGVAEKRNDDGEPSGSAGEPILNAVRRSGMTDVLVAVVRWFGGVKLGTGGLGRAYGEAADLAITRAGSREVLLGRRFRVVLPYASQKTVSLLLAQHRGRVTNQEFGAEVTFDLWLPHSRWRAFAASLTEASQGTLDLEPVAETTDDS